MQKKGYIVVLALLFLGTAFLLRTFGFWHRVGLEEPKGFEVQGLLFLVFLFVMQKTLFGPYVAILDERHEQTEGKRKRAEELDRQAREMREKYRKAVDDARLEALHERERMALEAEEAERADVARVKIAENERLLQLRNDLGREADLVRRELSSQLGTFTAEIVGRIFSTNQKTGPKTAVRAVSQ